MLAIIILNIIIKERERSSKASKSLQPWRIALHFSCCYCRPVGALSQREYTSQVSLALFSTNTLDADLHACLTAVELSPLPSLTLHFDVLKINSCITVIPLILGDISFTRKLVTIAAVYFLFTAAFNNSFTYDVLSDVLLVAWLRIVKLVTG